jgi:hypothetical protein
MSILTSRAHPLLNPYRTKTVKEPADYEVRRRISRTPSTIQSRFLRFSAEEARFSVLFQAPPALFDNSTRATAHHKV